MGDDFRERKLTLPLIRAIAKADAEEQEFWRRTIEKGRQTEADLDTARALLDKHGALDSTRQTALDWADAAKAALAPLPDHQLTDLLGELADYVVARLR